MRAKSLRLLPLGALFLSLLLSEPPAMLLMAAGAIVLHEAGHVLGFVFLTGALPTLEADHFGLRLMPPRPLLPREELWIALFGPFFNIFLGVLLCQVGGGFFFSLGAMHFLFALFNLLPYEGSDGGRVFHLLFLRLFRQKNSKRASVILSASTLSFFYFLSLYVFYFTGEGLSCVFFSVFSFPWHDLEHFDDL